MKFSRRLQLLIIPAILFPNIIITAYLIFQMYGTNQQLQYAQLEFHSEQLRDLASDQYAVLQRSGLTQSPFFVNQSQKNIFNQIKNNSIPKGINLIYDHDFNLLWPDQETADTRGPAHMEEILPAEEDIKIINYTTSDGSRYQGTLQYIHEWQWYTITAIGEGTLSAPVIQSTQRIGLFFLLTITLIILMIQVLSRSVSSPIIELVNLTNSYGQGDLSLRAQPFSVEEIDQLGQAFNGMADNIENLKSNLETRVRRRTQDLENSLVELKETQSQLVEAEKMAALGNLVAGVAHEINTPLGICITAASLLDTNVENIRETFHSPKGMTKTQLEDFLETSLEISKTLMTNLSRSKELVTNFKQVAVDQIIEEKRSFPLYKQLEDIFLSLKSKLKSKKITLQIEGPQDLYIQFYPGVLWQIISNLVMNSLIHGFDDKGIISLSFQQSGSHLKLVYEDNGKGIPDKIRNKVFNPFFTTNRGKGSTGLGLHIIYNLITRVGGTIVLVDKAHPGVRFDIDFPLT